MNETELRAMVDALGELRPREKIGAYANDSLISALREFIESVHRTPLNRA